MNILQVYPTSRALRTIAAQHKESDTLLPTLMRMDEFEQRAILIEQLTQIDSLERILFLREAADFSDFKKLGMDLSLVRFFTKSEALFKFFEELSAEKVDFEKLAYADAYAEFGKHLSIMQRLLEKYHGLLLEHGYTDKAFLPQSYSLNKGFIQNYKKIEIYLEGYLSRFELELLEKISQLTELTIYYTTGKFNVKMQERFSLIGIELPMDAHTIFSLTEKKLLSQEPNQAEIMAKVFSVEERTEQVAVALAQIQQMVDSGIAPEEIVLILPDEQFKEQFMLYDRQNNLNFAMGYDYSRGRIYKTLDALYRYWQQHESDMWKLLQRYGFPLDRLEQLAATKQCSVEVFFDEIDKLELLDISNDRVEERQRHFLKIFAHTELSLKVWLFLWLKTLSKVTIDDVRGGLVTVMGVLETRGICFKGVVIVDFNESIVPSNSSKDQFLNSKVRAFADLPTGQDREALQKQYYKRLLEQAKEAVILYSTSDNKLPSKFLYELELKDATQASTQLELLYDQPSQRVTQDDPQIKHFDATHITWSASRLKVYLECKRKYYYRYIQKIEASQEEEFNEGLFLHQLLDQLFDQRDSYTSVEEMTTVLHQRLDKLLSEDTSETAYQKQLYAEKLKPFIAHQIEHFKMGYKLISRESEYTATIGGLQFKGRIDRIDQNSIHTLILDYKSGSTKEANRTKNLEMLTDFQMSIYSHIAGVRFQNTNYAFVKILDDGALEEITLLEEKNELLEVHITELKQTKSFVAQKCEELQKCKWCEFALMCGRGEYL